MAAPITPQQAAAQLTSINNQLQTITNQFINYEGDDYSSFVPELNNLKNAMDQLTNSVLNSPGDNAEDVFYSLNDCAADLARTVNDFSNWESAGIVGLDDDLYSIRDDITQAQGYVQAWLQNPNG